ncbi:MAG: hypothetical protein K9K21_12890 [Desulfotignum sp.]|nr:hypothetical protein [Desulfotignum sp.]
MEKEHMSDSGRAGMTDMPIIRGWIEKQGRYTNTGIYPEDEEMANALCLVCLMINKNRLPIDGGPMITKTIERSQTTYRQHYSTGI